MCTAHYLKGEAANIAVIIREAGDEVTEPFGVDFSFMMHNYRGIFTVSFFSFGFLMIHIMFFVLSIQ